MKKSLLTDSENDETLLENGSIDFNALFEFSKLLNSSLDLKFILDHILLSSMGKMLLTKGCMVLLKNNHFFSFDAVKGLPCNLLGEKIEIRNLPESIFFINELDRRKFKWGKRLIILNLIIGIPIKLKNKVLGIIFFGEKLTKKPFSRKDLYFLKVLSNIASTSIENSLIVHELKRVNRDLDQKIQQLNTLFDIGKEFAGLFEIEKIVRLLSFSIMGQMGLQKYAILLKEEEDVKILNSRITNLERVSEKLNILHHIDKPGLINSFKSKIFKDCLNSLKALNVQAIIPMQFNRETKGIILLGEKLNKEKYSLTDIEFIYSLANLAMLSIENARLFKETLEKQRMDEEIQIAKEIQQGLLPKRIPKMEGFDVAAFNIPSKQVGGDYFDIVKTSDETFILAIADVSGKGIPASLLMSNLQAMLHAYAPMIVSLPDATGKINDIVYENTDMSKFITFFWGILNIKEKSFTYVNAGHNPPILIHKNGTIEYLSKGGVILGVIQTTIPYEEGKTDLQQGDILFMYTDGVSESLDANHKEFGEERIIEILKTSGDEESFKIINKIYQEISIHSSGIPQYDDITMIAIKTKI